MEQTLTMQAHTKPQAHFTVRANNVKYCEPKSYNIRCQYLNCTDPISYTYTCSHADANLSIYYN